MNVKSIFNFYIKSIPMGSNKRHIFLQGINPGLVRTELSKNVKNMSDIFNKVPAINPSDVADALMYALGTRPEVQV